MGLNKRLLCPGPTKKPTKEQEERIERAWEVFCEKGSVCITDPEKTDEYDLIEMLKKDPKSVMIGHFEYNLADGMSLDEFIERSRAGEYEKEFDKVARELETLTTHQTDCFV